MPRDKVLLFSLVAVMAAGAACQDARTSTFQAPAGAEPSRGGAAAAPSGDLADRVRRLEEENTKNAEAMAFLNKVYGQQKQQEEQQRAQREATTPAPDAMFAIDVTGDPFDGPADAPVTLVKAYDFACPYCQIASEPLRQLVKDYNGKLRVVYKNFVVHPQVATPAHLAGCAAQEQQKYMPFKEAFWEKGYAAYRDTRDQSKMGEDNILAIAQGVGLNMDKFKADMKGEKCKKLLDADMAELSKFGTNATPSFYINGQPYQNGIELGAFKSVIDQKLKEVESSGVAGKDYYQKVVMAKGEKKFRGMKEPKPS
jgi:protein-disulfide isomerase